MEQVVELSQKRSSVSQSKKRPRSTVTINIDSESDNEKTRTSKKKAYENQRFFSIGEAIIQVENIWNAACRRTEDKKTLQFNAEMRQKNQHHELQMGKQEEVLLRLRLKLQKQKQESSSSI